MCIKGDTPRPSLLELCYNRNTCDGEIPQTAKKSLYSMQELSQFLVFCELKPSFIPNTDINVQHF